MIESNGWLTIPDPFAATLLARAGFDSVTLDMQHGLFDEASVVRTLLALGADRPRRFVRVPWNEPGVIGKMLDAGADGLIVPMVNGADDALRLASASHYPPDGTRSFGPVLAALRAGALPYAAAAANVDVFAMIETRSAFEEVERIVATPGITGLYVGPNDLGLALGYGPGTDREEPAMTDALKRVAAVARSAGKRAGLFCLSPVYARARVADGFNFLTIANDARMLAEAAANATAAFRED